MNLTIRTNKYYTIQVHVFNLLLDYVATVLFLGVFSDMMNLIFRKKFKPKSAKLNWDEVGKSQHEIIVSTSLQFLKMLAR